MHIKFKKGKVLYDSLEAERLYVSHVCWRARAVRMFEHVASPLYPMNNALTKGTADGMALM